MLDALPLEIGAMKFLAFTVHPVRAFARVLFVLAALAPAIPAAPPSAAARKIGAKLDGIEIPRVAFDEATVEEALEFLRLQMIGLDTEEAEPGAKGVNFVDLRGAENAKPITLGLEKVPAREVLKYTCLLAGCEYAIESEAIVITDKATRRNPGGGGADASDASPQSRVVEKYLASAVIPAIHFEETELGEAMEFLRAKLSEMRGSKAGNPPINFVLVDSALAKTSVSLKLQNASARGILGYLMEAAGTEFTIERGIVTIRKWPETKADPADKAVVLPPVERIEADPR